MSLHRWTVVKAMDSLVPIGSVNFNQGSARHESFASSVGGFLIHCPWSHEAQ